MSSTVLFEHSSDISDEIERVRSEMVELGEHFGLLHPDVQKCSEHLDRLLNHFYVQHVKSK